MQSSDYYDSIAPDYEVIASRRKAYLDAVDNIVKNSASQKNIRILDIGSGDGQRISKIFSTTQDEIWAIENSSEMFQILNRNSRVQRKLFISIEDFMDTSVKFNLITSLWNVFGHIYDIEIPLNVIKKQLNTDGKFIFDVNNPYNVKNYGYLAVLKNSIKIFLKMEPLTYNLNTGQNITSVFFRSPKTYKNLLRKAGFTKIEIRYIDYDNGTFGNILSGQLLIVCN